MSFSIIIISKVVISKVIINTAVVSNLLNFFVNLTVLFLETFFSKFLYEKRVNLPQKKFYQIDPGPMAKTFYKFQIHFCRGVFCEKTLKVATNQC
jgi:hypothetical protein